MTNIIVEKEAGLFRQKNGLGANDPIRLKSILTYLDVITVYKPLGADFSGMALKVQKENDTARFILINSTHSLGKQHFTICHELYHLFIQKEFNAMVCQTGRFNKKDKEEFNADYFAAVLLLPESGVKSLIPDKELSKDKITLRTILKIEHYYSCSRAALLYRLIELKIISKSYSENFRQNIKLGALQHGYNTNLYSNGNNNLVLGNYGDLAFELYDKEIISETYYYTLLKDLGLTDQELQIIINGEEE
ncbi:ImmA/IrrE family metallo-endopeptidase [Formosa sp. S-31]|uniref:ImmA/IrrE family metallo-endopeptidase n=1 Tax=Formosa sp. S-31 TaxID=2790949 RepID=UPI003EBA6538